MKKFFIAAIITVAAATSVQANEISSLVKTLARAQASKSAQINPRTGELVSDRAGRWTRTGKEDEGNQAYRGVVRRDQQGVVRNDGGQVGISRRYERGTVGPARVNRTKAPNSLLVPWLRKAN